MVCLDAYVALGGRLSKGNRHFGVQRARGRCGGILPGENPLLELLEVTQIKSNLAFSMGEQKWGGLQTRPARPPASAPEAPLIPQWFLIPVNSKLTSRLPQILTGRL